MQSLISFVLVLGFISPCLCYDQTKNGLYNVMNYGAKGDGRSDDAQAFLRAWQSTCGAKGMATLVIPPNYEFLLSPFMLKGPCHASSVQIQLRGKVVAAEKNSWASYKYTWILISNVNGLTVDGSGGSLDGFGSSWWSCRNCPRPSVITFNSCNGLRVTYLSIINSPKSHININNCVGATFSGITIQSPPDSHNTDGIAVYASKNIWIKDSTIGCGDDCIAISGGSSCVNVTGIACGPGHGISIGSLGNGNSNTVDQVHVRNCNFTNTQNGARIKTYADGSGYAKGITFEEIKLIQTRNPIIINQFYTNASPSLENGGVQVSGITFRGFHGTSMTNEAITLNCGPQGCFNIVLDQNSIASSQLGKPASCSCKNAHGTITSSVPNCPCLLP